MLMRDMGNKEGGRTWWGAVILVIGMGLTAADVSGVPSLLPAPYSLLIPTLITGLGFVTGYLGIGRKYGEMIKLMRGGGSK